MCGVVFHRARVDVVDPIEKLLDCAHDRDRPLVLVSECELQPRGQRRSEVLSSVPHLGRRASLRGELDLRVAFAMVGGDPFTIASRSCWAVCDEFDVDRRPRRGTQQIGTVGDEQYPPSFGWNTEASDP